MRPDNNGLARDTYTGASTSVEVSDASKWRNTFRPLVRSWEVAGAGPPVLQFQRWAVWQRGRHTRPALQKTFVPYSDNASHSREERHNNRPAVKSRLTSERSTSSFLMCPQVRAQSGVTIQFYYPILMEVIHVRGAHGYTWTD